MPLRKRLLVFDDGSAEPGRAWMKRRASGGTGLNLLGISKLDIEALPVPALPLPVPLRAPIDRESFGTAPPERAGEACAAVLRPRAAAGGAECSREKVRAGVADCGRGRGTGSGLLACPADRELGTALALEPVSEGCKVRAAGGAPDDEGGWALPRGLPTAGLDAAWLPRGLLTPAPA